MDTEAEMTRFLAEVIQDPDNPENVIIDLGQQVCDHLGWREGDTLEWHDNKDGTWTIRKKT